ncbi:MAG: T9SS type A sorting domain-containing protein, partial [Paludibacter sp.]
KSDGTTLLYLSLVCNSGSGPQTSRETQLVQAATKSEVVKAVTMASYYKAPASPTSIIDNQKISNEMSYFPIPVKDQLFVSFDNAANENLQLNVMSVDGRLISSTTVSAKSGHNNFELNTTQLQKGIYILTMSRNGLVFNSNKLSKN